MVFLKAKRVGEAGFEGTSEFTPNLSLTILSTSKAILLSSSSSLITGADEAYSSPITAVANRDTDNKSKTATMNN